MDAIAQFKSNQKQLWAGFAALEMFTGLAAPFLIRSSKIASGARVLDVGCGTGVVALGAARAGARVTGVDLTPELIVRARENATLCKVEIEFREGDVEALPLDDASFDVVLSQFGHMFAPRPEVALSEMLRVLRPGGTLAFSTWPPELLMGRMFALIGKHGPPLPPGVAPPPQWGDPNIVRERLGGAVTDVVFDRSMMRLPMLSPAHGRAFIEQNTGPVLKLSRALESEPARLASFRRELEELIALYFEDNAMRQDFLITRATKV